MIDDIIRILLARKLDKAKIIADGDLDGIIASGLLSGYCDDLGIECKVQFPAPAQIASIKAENSFLIELPPSKGITYSGNNILIDHHGKIKGIAFYEDERIVLMAKSQTPNACASNIISTLLIGEGKITKQGRAIIKAVADIDEGVYETEFARNFHRAYLLNISDPKMRDLLCTYARNREWRKIRNWAHSETKKWSHVESTVRSLKAMARQINSFSVYFPYDIETELEYIAMREAMLRLEEKNPIVVAIGVKEEGASVIALRASIGTKDPEINLSPVFDFLTDIAGVTAGGRSSIGGASFSGGKPLEDVIHFIKRGLRKLKGNEIYEQSSFYLADMSVAGRMILLLEIDSVRMKWIGKNRVIEFLEIKSGGGHSDRLKMRGRGRSLAVGNFYTITEKGEEETGYRKTLREALQEIDLHLNNIIANSGEKLFSCLISESNEFLEDIFEQGKLDSDEKRSCLLVNAALELKRKTSWALKAPILKKPEKWSGNCSDIIRGTHLSRGKYDILIICVGIADEILIDEISDLRGLDNFENPKRTIILHSNRDDSKATAKALKESLEHKLAIEPEIEEYSALQKKLEGISERTIALLFSEVPKEYLQSTISEIRMTSMKCDIFASAPFSKPREIGNSGSFGSGSQMLFFIGSIRDFL